ncbi:YbaB/EbfC family nucleoid-associated protein [Actinophytocola gossypii]|uniref:YbaB/EbfC family nucleoid-associated protein n=1 Tax=Actinophytocola gossypii TaxID=2812003 RepID=A0ABT2JHG8_9PSEU|nr:YbaB/EbfC family nucleoid-associated protein [Actinophytocola gossypii]MCT2587221.1 YbaB/EbfC family nucleoid-associated protein [Actinophytocola gossypii]
MDTEQWLAQYDKRISEIAARAEEAGARLRQVGGTASSPRGEVEVRVGASGVLEDLTLTPAARALESDELSRLIVDTTRRARHAAGARVAGISAEFFGEGPALEVIRQHLPAGAPAPRNRDEDDYFANPEVTR